MLPRPLLIVLGVMMSLLGFASHGQAPAALQAEAPPLPEVEFRFVETNGVRLRVAMQGNSGPLVIMAHGWPESWYSWRHQMRTLAQLGYRVAAPDMRGYGASDAPADVSAYDIETLAADMAGLVTALGEEQAVMVGHDWGAIVAWHAVLLYPERFNALVAMSVPYSGRPAQSPLQAWQQQYGENFYYILYHQEPGVAEAEYDADPRALLRRLYVSPGAPRQAPAITDPRSSAGGWVGRLGEPSTAQPWLSEDDLDYLVRQFQHAGFRGGLNYYRNFHSNWENTAHLDNARISVPTLFIAGEQDVVIGGASREQLEAGMSRVVDDLRDVVLLPGVGHWVQQEAPQATTETLLDFLESL